MARLRIGIIGCGEVVQILHLPALDQLSDLYEVTALCDVSQSVLTAVGDKWRIQTRLRDYHDLIALDSVDAVLIANPNPYHTEVILAALEAKKHILVEKPMCMNLAENDAIITAQEKAGTIIQVGTMRRYAPAFVEACRLVSEMPEIRLARVHDVIGGNAQFIEPTSKVTRADDIPAPIMQATRDLEQAKIHEAIGEVPDALQTAYKILLGLSTHDISAMRELLGTPKRVLNATQRKNGIYQTATLDYGDYVCLFETGIDNIPRFDAFLEVYGRDQVVRVDYNTPYVRNLPIRLTVTKSTDGKNTIQEVIHPGWGDAFTEEWRAFYDNVTHNRTPKTSPADFRHDLVIFQQMIKSMSDTA
ncbi:MAG: Gfo/Idh/MocA family oxidoreductase [Anaerolineae bacterium]|nr:Gfo/Idh/MocA family oxidoreductase [Anaerolineae bacterium]